VADINRRRFFPRWARNGRELFYLSLDVRTMMSVELTTSPTFHAGAPKALFETPGGIWLRSFRLSSRNCVATVPGRGGSAALLADST
jgi:hypothetical protein